MGFFASVLCCTISALLLSLTSANPQQAASPISTDKQAAAILTQSLAALQGGIVISDVTLSGSAHQLVGPDDDTGTVMFKATANGFKLSFTDAKGARIEVRTNNDKGLSGTWLSPDGAVHPVPYHNLLADMGLFPTFTLLRFVSPDAVVSLVGQETHNGAAVAHLSAYQQGINLSTADPSLGQRLSQTEIFVDTKTQLPNAIAYNTHPDGDALVDIPVEIDFDKYQSVNGAQVPFHIQKFINGSLVFDLTLISAIPNTGLSASDFNLN